MTRELSAIKEPQHTVVGHSCNQIDSAHRSSSPHESLSFLTRNNKKMNEIKVKKIYISSSFARELTIDVSG